MEQSGDSLSSNLKKIREDRNLSLDKLSELTGVSKSMLRQIEIGQSNPTINTIWKIANGLKVPFTALLREPTQEITLRGFKAEPPLKANIKGYRVYPLVPFSPERSFESYYFEMEPGAVLHADPHQGNAEEQIFVMQGQIEIAVAGEQFTVHREHFISFRADCEHRYQNRGSEMVNGIMLISYLA
jgi:transcriptional regulator with XRE-family HTH domain